MKHAWLENEVESVTPERAVARCTREGGWAKLEADFPMRLESARSLANRLSELFSPSDLIERCTAFADVDDETKSQIQNAVHETYLQTSGISNRQQPLLDAVNRLEVCLQAFRDSCLGTESLSESAGCKTWEQVLDAAEKLRTLLDRLPRGIVFP